MVGVLTVDRMEAAPKGAQGYGRAFNYFSFRLESFKVLESAERAFPELSPK
jgi:hypothetical protein